MRIPPATCFALLLGAALAGCSNRDAPEWVKVDAPQDPHNAFFFEGRRQAPQSVIQKARILVNHGERSARNEASTVYEVEFDCLTGRHETRGAKTYFSRDGAGEMIRDLSKSGWGITGGFGFNAVRDRLCGEGLRDLSAQTPYAVGVWDLDLLGFLACRLGDRETRDLIERIRARVNPLERRDGAFVYRATGETGGYEINLPVSRLMLGVCDRSGDVACGAAHLLALQVDWPLEQTRDRLHAYRRSGIDYTRETQDEDTGATLRPVLVANPQDPKSSLLFCDAGRL